VVGGSDGGGGGGPYSVGPTFSALPAVAGAAPALSPLAAAAADGDAAGHEAEAVAAAVTWARGVR
jgi:hypothetical protein